MQTQKIKKIPERQCLGCNEHKPKRELVRVVRLPDGSCLLDLKGKVSGRGAYICPCLSCFRKARKQRRLEASLECSIPDEVYKKLEEELNVDNR